MYRQNASPTAETLHTMVVHTAKGMMPVALLFTGAIVCAVTCVVLVLASGRDDDLRAVEIASGVGTVVFGAIGFVRHAARRRTMRIERIGSAHQLTIDGAGVELEFPLACHGSQFVNPIGAVKMHEVHLQLVDAKKRAITLHETRGAAYGPQENWFNGDIDRHTISVGAFDVPGLGEVAKVRDWVRALTRDAPEKGA